jgi:mannitol/fructose-specific phosphotransferase system IIA component (Ntr-type)
MKSTFSGVARLLGLSDRGSRSSIRPGARSDHIDAIDRLEWSLARRVALPEGSCPWEPQPGPDEVPPGLYETFRAGGLLQHPGGDLQSVIESFADAYAGIYRHGREELLMKMEPHRSSGFLLVGDGIAVSHPRHPVVLPMPEPAISVCLTDAPVPLSPDGGRSARVFLAIFCPTVSMHLAVLARLSRLVARARFLEVLDAQNPREAIMDLAWLHDCGLADEEILVGARW